ncbi:Uncharacterized protein FKW44_006129, partial [Caligus rogercresseyi]
EVRAVKKSIVIRRDKRMQKIITELFKRKDRVIENENQEKVRKTDGSLHAVPCAKAVNESNVAGAGPSTNDAGPAASTAYPPVWSKEQFEQFRTKNEWLYAQNGMLGCISCRDVKGLGVSASRGVNIVSNWAEGNIAPCGHSRTHRESAAHNEAVKILKTAQKEILLNMNATSQESAFEATAKVFRTAYFVAKHDKPFTDFEKLIDLQEANSLNLGRILHSKTVCVDIIDHVSTQMKHQIVRRIIENKSKITVLADESTSVGHKSTLIVFLKASIDGEMEPIAFPLDLIELDNLSAAHIKGKIMHCLLNNGFTMELLQEMLIGFCSDGANVMLGVKSGVGKLLQGDFPNIIIWHCLNHRLELAVAQALEATGGTKDFQAFLDALYTLYSQSPKSMRELSECAHNLQITLRRIGRVFNVRWVASSWRAVNAMHQKTAQKWQRESQFQGLLSKLCSINFLKNLALMADVLIELKNLSEILQNRRITLPKAHDIMLTYIKRIESFITYPGQHTVEASQAEKDMKFKEEDLKVGRSPIIDASQFIQAVADSLNERLFTTTANRAQAS